MRLAVYRGPELRMLALDWPDDWRVPVHGEHLMLGEDSDTYVVTGVQWEFGGEDEPAVMLRVTAL